MASSNNADKVHQAQRESESNGRQRIGDFTSFLPHYGAIIGALGLAIYGLLRLAYSFFYIQLRTSPEEVGYTYSRLLSESVAGVVELTLLSAAIVALSLVIYHLIKMTFNYVKKRGPDYSVLDAIRSTPFRKARQLGLLSVVIGATIVFLSLPALAWWQGSLARDGQTVRNLYFVGIPYLPVLAVQAVPADVQWKDGDDKRPIPLSNRSCLMYLGQANGTTVLFDVRSNESIRLPSSDIVVVLRFAFSAPEPCLT